MDRLGVVGVTVWIEDFEQWWQKTYVVVNERAITSAAAESNSPWDLERYAWGIKDTRHIFTTIQKNTGNMKNTNTLQTQSFEKGVNLLKKTQVREKNPITNMYALNRDSRTTWRKKPNPGYSIVVQL